jgi:hypothetical protein
MEYKSAAWLDRNMQGRRVMASGSGHVFLNAWSDVPQLSGGFDQGVTNIVVPSAIHWFYKAWNEIDRNGATTILLMRALGVHAICVGGPNSKDFFKPQVHPERFAACGLPVLWREGDDVIYGIPARSTSLAHVMARGDLVRHRLNIPVHLEEVERYVSALEKPSYPLAEIEWHRPARGTVKADLTQGQVLSLQICHHPGWHATVNGEPRRVFSDGLGLMAVEPGCQGRCTVELVYDGGWEATIARWFSRITLALALLWCAARAMSRFANVRA